ncbi:MAG: cell division protein ZapE [Proteobacteria bacterium]|nr:cell division protein ZapE [Pseudomonadota bacterium]
MKITIDNKEVSLDPVQISVLHKLDQISQKLSKYNQNLQQKSALHKLFSRFFKQKHKHIPSLYIHGKVGRGKSMLMTHFFNNLAIENKLYLHFNQFMQKVHKQLHQLRNSDQHNNKDLVEIATKAIIKDNVVLCFDEFQVEDVTDALILRRMFSYIFANNILVIFTSNCHPEELYQNGLQRDLFLKFIHQTLEPNCQIINLDGKQDYRSRYLDAKKHYFFPNNKENKSEILKIFSKITDSNPVYPTEIEVLGRKLMVKNSYKNIALFDFAELCIANLGVADYQAICQKFSVIFLINVPKLTKEDRNEAKRLVLFIDEVYQNKVKLLILADSKVEEIYAEGTGAKVFKRCASRINEITSENYLKS